MKKALIFAFILAACSHTFEKPKPPNFSLLRTDEVVLFGKVEVKSEIHSPTRGTVYYGEVICFPLPVACPEDFFDVEFGEYFTITVRKREEHLIRGLRMHGFPQFFGWSDTINGALWIEDVPQGADVVYVGTLVFEEHYSEPGWLGRLPVRGYSVKDEHEEAEREFHDRYPKFAGEFVKRLAHKP